MAAGLTSPITIEDRERVSKALKLRLAGMPYAEIAAACGYGDDTACSRAVRKELKRREVDTSEAAQELRTIELERLDRMALKMWPGVEAGKEAAILTMLKIMARRAALCGLDAPQTQIVKTDIANAADLAYLASKIPAAVVPDDTAPGE